ncbi:NAD-dependent epimerase/dehydratase family protein [Kordiimonas pumila]|uniref:NAD-dependent epimerase/dehydratase family protein n=1 Tax=Kordiimonas pumila TaxID=2161677 RepID=A0ABV7D0V3_9PROT|nr:SDR family oxidoreductase [Kordiimonas pumila]
MVDGRNHLQAGVLGASGLIGQGIYRVLAKAGGAVSIGRTAAMQRQCDIDEPLQAGTFSSLDTLVYAAGLRDEDMLTGGENAARKAADTALRRAEHVFECALQAGCKKLVYISSAHVYGALQGTITEDTALAPQSLYAETHTAVEMLAASKAVEAGGRCLILRPNAVYGMTFDPARFARWNLIPFSFPLAAIRHSQLEVRAPHAGRNFVSSMDIGVYVKAWLENKTAPQVQFLNPLGADTLTIGAFAAKCAKVAEQLTGTKVALKYGNSAAPAFLYASKYEKVTLTETIDDFLPVYARFCLEADVPPKC